jgi:hypothetical protein
MASVLHFMASVLLSIEYKANRFAALVTAQVPPCSLECRVHAAHALD